MATIVLKWHSVKYWIFKIGGMVMNWLRTQFLKDSLFGHLVQELSSYFMYKLHSPTLATPEGPTVQLVTPKLIARTEKKNKKKKK